MTEYRPSPEQEQAWIRESSLTYAALMGVGVVMVQPFLTASSISRSAFVCVVAFAIAIPLLAALVLVNHQENFRGRMTRAVIVKVAHAVALNAAFIGIAAGFWNITWIAGGAFLTSVVIGVWVHSAGWVRLEQDVGALSQHSEEVPDSGSETDG